MCGIVGTFQFKGVADRGLVQRGLKRIRHRGQDDEGTYVSPDSRVVLGHRRLSIIDLSHAGKQPMQSAHAVLSYNGEIYNYVELKNELQHLGYAFHTHSDTEVLLNAYLEWGVDCLAHFEGMFAFAIWDEKQKQLFCARDPFGIKPFYYHCDARGFTFASESTAIAEVTDFRLSNPGVGFFLLNGYVPGQLSMFESIAKLLPGHYVLIGSDGKMVEERYFSLTAFNQREATPDNRRKLTETFKESVTQQLRSDVKVGSFLSGGIDSGLITAFAAEQYDGLHTYSVGYEGLSVNELPLANALAKRYGTTHRPLILGHQDIVSTLDKALSSMCEPVADSAIVATYALAQMARDDGVKVLLNGTGGDELFGGYHRYSSATRLRYWARKVPRAFWATLVTMYPSLMTMKLSNPLLDSMLHTGGVPVFYEAFDQEHKGRSLLEHLSGMMPKHYFQQSAYYPLMLADLSGYIPDQLLLLLDQMTMCHTLEGRLPFLSKSLATAAFRFKHEVHVNGNETKRLLRDIGCQYLGEEHALAKKHGFGGPVKYWVTENQTYFLDTITNLASIPGFEGRDVEQWLYCSKGHNVNTQAIFRLYCFVKWYDSIKGVQNV